MPRFRVETSMGNFLADLDRAPANEQEMQALRGQIEDMLRAGQVPPGGSVGPLQEAMEPVRQAVSPFAAPPLPANPPLRGATEAMPWWVAMGAQAALPMAGTAGGFAVGGVPGAAAGAALGEYGNQALGLTEPSTVNLGIQAGMTGLMGPMGRAGRAAGEAAVTRLPGAAATMHELTEQQMEAMLRRAAPPVASEGLYAAVRAANPMMPLPQFRQMARDLLTEEQRIAAGLKLPGDVTTAARSLRRAAGPHRVQTGLLNAQGQPITRVVNPNQELPFQDAWENLKRIGAKVRETRDAGGPEHAAWKGMFKAIQDDFDAAVATGNPAAPTVNLLRQANAAAKREYAIDELTDLMGLAKTDPVTGKISRAKGGGITMRADLGEMATGEPQVQVNLNRIIKDIRASDDIRTSLTKAEVDDMVRDLGTMAQHLRALPPVAGANVGSFQQIGRLRREIGIGAGAVSVGGLGLVSPQAAMVLGGTGMLLARAAPPLLARAIATPSGRQLLDRILTGTRGTLNLRALSLLGAGLGSLEPVRLGGQLGINTGQAVMEGVMP